MKRRRFVDPDTHAFTISSFHDRTEIALEFDDLMLVPSSFYSNFRCALKLRGDRKRFGVFSEAKSYGPAHLAAALVVVAVVTLAVVMGNAILDPVLLATILVASIGCCSVLYGLIWWVNKSSLPKNPLVTYDAASDTITCHNGTIRLPRDQVVCLLATGCEPRIVIGLNCAGQGGG